MNLKDAHNKTARLVLEALILKNTDLSFSDERRFAVLTILGSCRTVEQRDASLEALNACPDLMVGIDLPEDMTPYEKYDVGYATISAPLADFAKRPGTDAEQLVAAFYMVSAALTALYQTPSTLNTAVALSIRGHEILGDRLEQTKAAWMESSTATAESTPTIGPGGLFILH